MRASSSLPRRGTSSPRDARGRVSYGGESGSTVTSSTSAGACVSASVGGRDTGPATSFGEGTSILLGRGGAERRAGLIATQLISTTIGIGEPPGDDRDAPPSPGGRVPRGCP